jgi:hypothetical protein
VAEGLPFVSVNVLSEEKRQQVIALGRLGWSLRRIERETKVRRETATAYLKAAGISVRLPGAWGRRPPPKPANEVSPDSRAAAECSPRVSLAGKHWQPRAQPAFLELRGVGDQLQADRADIVVPIVREQRSVV